MAVSDSFQQHIADIFAPIGRIHFLNMFGGAAVYAEEVMFGLIANETFYIKTDDELRARLRDKGSVQFVWNDPSSDDTIRLSYMSLPDSAIDDAAEAVKWGRKALQVAAEARIRKVKSPRRIKLMR